MRMPAFFNIFLKPGCCWHPSEDHLAAIVMRKENEQVGSEEKVAMTGSMEAGPIADLFETTLCDEIVKHQKKDENVTPYWMKLYCQS